MENEFLQARGKEPALQTTDFHQTLARNWQFLSVLPATNPTVWAEAVDRLLNDEPLRRRMAAAATPRMERFSLGRPDEG